MALMAKHQILVNKHLPIQAPRNKHWQRISDLFKLIKKDTTVINILFLHCCYHFSAWYFAFWCFYCKILNGITYTYAETQSTALHLFELLSRIDNFLGILRKSQIMKFEKHESWILKNLFGWLLYVNKWYF